MKRVLVTGSRGLVGSALLPTLGAAGLVPVEYDLELGLDVLDVSRLRSTARSCDAIVHLAAVLDPGSDDLHQLREVNVGGTLNVLEAARAAGIGRVVYMSSAAVLGVFKGHRHPDYLPLDELHPRYAVDPYGRTKLRGEHLCKEFADIAGQSVFALRPPGVWTPDTYRAIERARAESEEFEWTPYWEYGAFIDSRDLADAVVASLFTASDAFEPLLVASSDISTSGRSSLDLVRLLLPDVDWRGDDSYARHPHKSLINIDRAVERLGWKPRHTWQRFVASARA